jgi:hypothetical protein
MKWTLIFITANLFGILLYQNYSDPIFLYINLSVMAYQLYKFVRVCVLVFSPNWEVELAYADTSASWKLLHNATQAFSIYMFYQVGWDFIGGFSALYVLITTLSILISIWDIDLTEENDK